MIKFRRIIKHITSDYDKYLLECNLCKLHFEWKVIAPDLEKSFYDYDNTTRCPRCHEEVYVQECMIGKLYS